MDDQLTQLLLTRLAGNQDSGAPLAEVLAQTMGDDPVASSLLTALSQRTREPDDELDPEIEERIELLEGEIDALRDVTRILADALGACPRCFGQDELCTRCRGLGRPGRRRPDPVLFEELVLPAWQRHELDEHRVGPSGPDITRS